MRLAIPDELARILAHTPELQQAYLVGGCVRDALWGRPNKDYDLEVFGVDYEQLSAALARWGKTDLVGRSFGVVKLSLPEGGAANYDFTIPRRDSKVSPGHKGFSITLEPDITPQEAASRRDFTVNAMMYDPRRQELLDFFGGMADLQNRVLRHTGEAFKEDPLRVLRGMQFASRYGLETAAETLRICRDMKASYTELAVERVREEWFKWAAKSTVPSAGLKYLVATDWIEHFPEIQAVIGTPQDPEWHPEGDVFIHTCHCCDALVKLPGWQAADEESRIVLGLAVLAHDFGKPKTTQWAVKGGRRRIVSPGHEEAGGLVAEQFMQRLRIPLAIQKRVIPLVTHHLAHLQTITDRSVRRLAKRLEPENIRNLCLVMTADHLGRPPKPSIAPSEIAALEAKAAELEVQSGAPTPILRGRDLIQVGMAPGKEMGRILEQAFEAQMEGKILDLTQAWQWLAQPSAIELPEDIRNKVREKIGQVGLITPRIEPEPDL